MAATAHLPAFINRMKQIYIKGDMSDEAKQEIERFITDFCTAIHDHILTAEVNTTVTGTAGPYPVKGQGVGGLS